jgi:hypothetical protein
MKPRNGKIIVSVDYSQKKSIGNDASKILLALIDYESNDSIRNSVAGALPGLIKCVKSADPSAIAQIQ